MKSNIIKLPGRPANPTLAKMEEAVATFAMRDIAILCEVAGISWQMSKPEMLTQFADLLVRLYDLNLRTLPREPLKVDDLALCAGGGLFPYYEKNFMARAADPAADRLNLADPATHTAVINRALHNLGAVVPVVTAHLMKDENRRYGHYYAQGENVAQLFANPALGLEDSFDGLSIFRRINTALETHGLEPLRSPFTPPPPRLGGGPRPV
jgi:hypothetical protein